MGLRNVYVGDGLASSWRYWEMHLGVSLRDLMAENVESFENQDQLRPRAGSTIATQSAFKRKVKCGYSLFRLTILRKVGLSLN